MITLPTETRLILGPPGTGKTTQLLNIIENLFAKGADPKKVCFVSFTKRAAQEARERAKDKFYFSDTDLHLFRTLHSLAFHVLGAKRNDIVNYRDYTTVARVLGYGVTAQRWHEDGSWANYVTKGDRLFHLEALARSRSVPLDTIWKRFLDDDINLNELSEIAQLWGKHKQVQGKIDFTDLITRFTDVSEFPYTLDALIVDEAQDLSTVQWKMVEKLAKHTKLMYVAGDDDQAIYSWAGADVGEFIGLKAKKEILTQSYRVPRLVHKVAKTIAGKINKRTKKEYKPRPDADGVGKVEAIDNLGNLDMSKGTWLLLVRNIAFFPEYLEHCKMHNLIFECRHTESVSNEMLQAIVDWETLLTGAKVSVAKAKNVYEFMRVRVNFKHGARTKLDLVDDNELISILELQRSFGLRSLDHWPAALGKIPEASRDYLLSAVQKGEVIEAPRIRISTIHSIKGAEADNVVVCPDMTRRTYNEFEDPLKADDEWRVWYVAVTRARHNLYVLSPRTPLFVDYVDWL